MKIQQFRELEEMKQIELLIRSGACIAESSNKDYQTFLYRLHSFFVVVMYCAQSDALLQIISLNPKKEKESFADALSFYSKN